MDMRVCSWFTGVNVLITVLEHLVTYIIAPNRSRFDKCYKGISIYFGPFWTLESRFLYMLDPYAPASIGSWGKLGCPLRKASSSEVTTACRRKKTKQHNLDPTPVGVKWVWPQGNKQVWKVFRTIQEILSLCLTTNQTPNLTVNMSHRGETHMVTSKNKLLLYCLKDEM